MMEPAMGRIKDIQNQRFGRLVALYPLQKRINYSVCWHCRCDCGNEVDLTEDNLVHGNYKSCGCLKKELERDIHKQLHFVGGTCVEWIENRKHRSDNTSGFRGVYKCQNNRYRVIIGFKGRKYYVGRYNNFEDAVAARKDAETKIHDRFIEAYTLWKEICARDSSKKLEEFIFEVTKENGEFIVHTNAGTV